MGNLSFKKRGKSDKFKSKNQNRITKSVEDLTRPSSTPSIKTTRSNTNYTVLKALYSYQTNNANQLSFEVNDILYATEDIVGKNWYNAINKRTQLSGMIPYNYVRVIVDGSPSSLEYFYDVNRVECERLLQIMSNISGTYLIRPCADKSKTALSVRFLGSSNVWNIHHFIIQHSDNQWYIIIDTKFNNIPDLIDFYKKTPIIKNNCLTIPLPRNQNPPIQFQEMEVGRNNFIKIKILGKGCFGEVWQARWGERGSHVVAIKVIQSNMMSNEQFLTEAKVMHKLRHPKIVELLGVCTQPDNEPIYIITEFMCNGDLLSLLKSPTGRIFDFKNLIDIIAQISEGMAYLESKLYVHRDLRAANILVDANNMVKVADFGLARVLQDEESYTANESKFPVRWTAPEAVYGTFSTKSDVWSFGILIYEIVTYGAMPYSTMSTREVLDEITKRNYRLSNPNGATFGSVVIICTTPLYNLMLSCWHAQPENRPTFSFLQHELSNWDVSAEPQYEEQ